MWRPPDGNGDDRSFWGFSLPDSIQGTSKNWRSCCGDVRFCLSRGDIDVAPHAQRISVCTMHVAMGLEFRAVAVMVCDEDVVQLASRVEAAGSEGDLEEIYSTERHLLYFSCSGRATG